MLKQRRILAVIVLASSFLTGCGTGSSTPLATTSATLSHAEAVLPAEGEVVVNFNNTYLESIALNEPKARASATNTDKSFIKVIRSAQKTLDGAFYDISDEGATNELIAAKNRGVKVRLVTDSDNLVAKEDPSQARESIQRLKKAGIKIVDDERSAIMHHKFMVADGQYVWTGSTNLTPTSFYCHNNNALTIRSAMLAKQYTTEFKRLFVSGEFGSSTRPDDTSVDPVQLNASNVQVFFSPKGGGKAAVMAELGKAKSQVHFMTFSLTDPEIGDLMKTKAKAGVKIGGIFDRWLAAGEYSLFETFKSAKLDVTKDGNEALMHHKVIIIDKATVITGSYNYSNNAENNNNEAFLIIKDAPAVANAFEREYERLRKAAKENHPPPFKKPDPEQNTGI